MFCPACGTQNPEGAKFCAKCGKALQAAASNQPTQPQASAAQPAPQAEKPAAKAAPAAKEPIPGAPGQTQFFMAAAGVSTGAKIKRIILFVIVLVLVGTAIFLGVRFSLKQQKAKEEAVKSQPATEAPAEPAAPAPAPSAPAPAPTPPAPEKPQGS